MKLLISLQIILVLIFSTMTWAQHSHQHAENQIQLDHGKKWETDVALRNGMEKISKLIPLGVLKNSADPEIFVNLANKIEDQIQLLIKNCKLSPKADAQLHILIVQMLDGVKKMQNSSEASKQQIGLLKIVDALNLYGEYFHHPHWIKIETK